MPNVAGFAVFAVVSRYIGPAEFGSVALANGLVAVGAALLPFGYGEALVQRSELRDRQLSSVFWVCLICGVFAYGAVLVASPGLANLFHAELLAVMLPVVALKLIIDALAIVPQSLITRRMSFGLIASRTLVATVVASALSVVLALSGYGVWALVASQLAASVVALGAVAWGAHWRPLPVISRQDLRDMANYGLFSSGTRAMQLLTTQADAAFVGHALGVEQAGIYGFSRRIFQLITDVISGSLGTVAHPLFSSIQSDLERVRRGFLLATFLSCACAMPVFIGLALVADPAVGLIFGPHWQDAVWPIRIYCFLGLLTSVGMLQGGLILSRGLANWWFYYQLVSASTTLVLLIFAARYGVVVLLGLIALKTLVIWPFAVAKSARLTGVPLSAYLGQFVGPLVASLVMIGAVVFARSVWPQSSPIASLAADIALGGIVYLAALIGISGKRLVEVLSAIGLRRRMPE